MSALKAILSELVHLFVDDGSLALALVACCGLVGILVLLVPNLAPAMGPVLFLGCVGVLVGNVAVTARRRANGR